MVSSPTTNGSAQSAKWTFREESRRQLGISYMVFGSRIVLECACWRNVWKKLSMKNNTDVVMNAGPSRLECLCMMHSMFSWKNYPVPLWILMFNTWDVLMELVCWSWMFMNSTWDALMKLPCLVMKNLQNGLNTRRLDLDARKFI